LVIHLAGHFIEPEHVIILASLITLTILAIMLVARYAPPPVANIFQFLGESVMSGLSRKIREERVEGEE